jgi:hypothetical protein
MDSEEIQNPDEMDPQMDRRKISERCNNEQNDLIAVAVLVLEEPGATLSVRETTQTVRFGNDGKVSCLGKSNRISNYHIPRCCIDTVLGDPYLE